jgi:hypothetical protein
MDPETAQTVLFAIAAVGFVAWIVGLQFLIASSRVRPAGSQQADGTLGLTDETLRGWYAGSTEVEGDASALASRAASILAKGGAGPVKIVEKTNDRLRFERVVTTGRTDYAAGPQYRQGELRFTPLGSGRTRIDWAVEPPGLKVLLWLGGAFLAVGLIVLVAISSLLYSLVVRSPNPAVRWQTFQMFQAVHFLWPPFLFGGLYRVATRRGAAHFEALVSNLPYHEG